MPSPISTNFADRETVAACAPWWNHAPDPSTGPTLTILRAKAGADLPDGARVLSDDGEYVLYEQELPRAPLERVELYRTSIHADEVWVQGKVKSFRTVNGKRPELDQAELARTKTLGYVRRVTRMTSAKGTDEAPTEETFRRLPTPDTNFLQAVIEALEEPVVPVLAEDYAKAAQVAQKQQEAIERHNDKAARGFPVGDAPAPVSIQDYAEKEAHDRYFRSDQGDLR